MIKRQVISSREHESHSFSELPGYATACCAYRPTAIRCLSIDPPPLPLPPPTCRARGCRDRLGIPKPPPPGGGDAPRGAPSTRAARLLGRTHQPRLPGVRCPRATLCQRPPCVSRAAHHRAKRRAGVWCSLPMLGPCAQRQRYVRACCAYRPTFIRCLSINPPPPPPPPPPSLSQRTNCCSDAQKYGAAVETG